MHTIDRRQIDAATQRFMERTATRARNERLIQEGRSLEIDSPERVESFFRRRAGAQTGEELSSPAPGTPRAPTQLPPTAALERMLGNNDLIGVAFLERGLQVAQSVGRIWVSVSAGRPSAYGTGFLVAPRLLLTNHHVIEDIVSARSSWAEFDYQLTVSGAPCPTTKFSLEPDTFFATNPSLDYTLVAVGLDGHPPRAISNYCWNPLIAETGKTLTGQWMNIIQHPNGEPKQLCFRENQLVDILDDFLHYKSDTAPGSSGSPVYNDRWEVVGLHHSGVWELDEAGRILATDGSLWREEMGEQRIKWIANEGVRISRIIADVRSRNLPPTQVQLFESSLQEVPTMGDSSDSSRTIAAATSIETRGADGSVTITVPLTISMRLGGPAAAPPTDDRVVQQAPVRPATSVSSSNEAIAEAARKEIGKRPDVIDVRLGYLFRNGWITNERAVVVTVREKLPPRAVKSRGVTSLPDNFMGLPVEVTSPSLKDLIRLTQGEGVATEVFPTDSVSREEITYLPPDGVILTQVTDEMRVCAHVSPDAGWPMLDDFLKGTKASLVVAMYDFGAPHIEAAVEALAGNQRRMTLVMQRGESVGSGTKADDMADQEVVDKLSAAFKTKFKNAWVKLGRVNGWVSSSYHIKVAVRDSKAFWLSSGNWQSSNQPLAYPLDENPKSRSWLNKYNRDWHAIIEHKGLAQTYEAFVLHDYSNNQAVADEALPLPDMFVPAAFLIPLEASRPFKYFAPFDETRQFTVTPLLTPDNYHQEILELIRGAENELLIQNQSFNCPGENHAALAELIDAVMQRIDAGVEVRVIFRVLMAKDARENLSALKDYGFPTDRIKVQKNCHTKAIIVDGKRVVLGSQNWSNDGVSVNRDASLLFDDAPLAQYFREIFEHDWDNLAAQNISHELGGVRVASPNEKTPDGMVRLSWKDYLETL